MDEIDFTSDSFGDILARDRRYDARAYALLVDVLQYLFSKDEHVDATAILDEFRERTLDQYGPMSYTVLTEWGVSATEDIGEMMFNLVEFKRIRKDEDDNPDDFRDGFDFKEAFLGPYQS